MIRKKKQPTRYIIVTGGVVSGNGKGITTASIGACLKARRMKVSIQKFDMYFNVDAGTLKPGKHGEVYVTGDGAETDLDLGHYERFLDDDLDRRSSVMQGALIKEIIEKERAGGFWATTSKSSRISPMRSKTKWSPPAPVRTFT